MSHKKSRNVSPLESEIELIKSGSDLRDYKFVTLDNGIEAILIRVPEDQSSKSAVAVAVAAGSMDEPDDFGGLAHFVEHCVFLGNKKYPNRNSLDKLLSKHNGYSNAHTELEYTAFYLEVNKEAISKAVDIFAAAFASPLFDCEMCCAELDAVDSEFHEVLNNDDCRIEQLICHVSDVGHPYKKFTWGNRSSLLAPRDPQTLVGAAKQFYERMYTPDRMKVSIVSAHSFAKMESLLKNSFGTIGALSTDPIRSPLIGCEFPITTLPLSFVIEPVTDINQLILLFQIPSILSYYKTKPVDYIAHLLGHESEGSLIAVLRGENLAVDISAGVGSDGYSNNSGLSLFELKLTLTQLGVAQYAKILSDYIYPYIVECRRIGITERVYLESKKIAHFQFEKISEKTSEDPIDVAEELAVAMLPHSLISRSDLLVSEFLFTEFQPEIIAGFFDHIVPEKALTLIVTKNCQELRFTEPVFGIKYGKVSLSIQAPEQPSGAFVIPPKLNEFVPVNDSAVKLPIQTKNSFVVPDEKIEEKNFTQYIFETIRSVPSPKLDIRILLVLTALPPLVVTAFVQTQVFVGYVSDLLEARLYSAKLSGYSVSLSATAPRLGRGSVGIELCVNGYFEKAGLIVEMVLDELVSKRPKCPLRLARVVETIRRGYVNEETHPVTSQALNARRVAIAPQSFFRSHEKLAVIEKMNNLPDEMQMCCVDAIYVGTNARMTAARIGPLLREIVVHNVDTNNVNAIVHANNVDANVHANNVSSIAHSGHLIVESTWNRDEPTGCLIIYYQLSPVFSLRLAAIADVLSDLMAEPFFDSLRTEEQLGYSVQCGSRSTNGSVGIEFMIQSSTESPEEMVKRVDRFVGNFFAKEISPMSEKEFNEQIEALVESLVEPPSSLGAEAKELWNEINEGRLLWNFNSLIKEEIRRLFLSKKNSIKNLVSEFLGPNLPRVVVLINRCATD